MTTTVGYFMWAKGMRHRQVFPMKCAADYESSLMRETRKSHDRLLVPGTRRPLDEAQWKLTLDELAAKFPCREIDT
jgi:hypothetical protein